MRKEITVLYHGTKFKKTANQILKEGFKEWSYFATDLNTALGQGGKYVFEVAFLKSELPDYWQVRCENTISPKRIIRLTKYQPTKVLRNKKVEKAVFANADEYCVRKPIVFWKKRSL